MKVVLKRVGVEPEVVEIEDTLEELQAAVDGYVGMHQNGMIAMLFDEDGKYKDKAPNFLLKGNVIVGDVVFCGIDQGDFVSLSDHAIQSILRRFKVMGWYS